MSRKVRSPGLLRWLSREGLTSQLLCDDFKKWLRWEPMPHLVHKAAIRTSVVACH
ncbi:Uncharacterised protein [Burkholderia pseudomallei]|nr:Uncharacterised protein [Burkholderia pseudomallei]CAJ2923435.1 Uncharacterised protein [Burkholderia pseudomallei]CAJ3027858.1 Uncharacterised protein [Burkholderia pseudomallei]VBC67457.1 Uncharacterised protein [Burkholderia pseudomallei]VBE52615.1 Uncharacterised protein [Burkholderia pseudomallei]